MPEELQRFHDAQQGKILGLPSFAQALSEIKSGRKTSHWIWYILPQLKELGLSAYAKKYGIRDFQEACNYLEDPLLFENYYSIVQELSRQLQLHSTISLMGSSIDAMKLVSSLSLFQEAAYFLEQKENKPPFNYQALYETCQKTLINAS